MEGDHLRHLETDVNLERADCLICSWIAQSLSSHHPSCSVDLPLDPLNTGGCGRLPDAGPSWGIFRLGYVWSMFDPCLIHCPYQKPNSLCQPWPFLGWQWGRIHRHWKNAESCKVCSWISKWRVRNLAFHLIFLILSLSLLLCLLRYVLLILVFLVAASAYCNLLQLLDKSNSVLRQASSATTCLTKCSDFRVGWCLVQYQMTWVNGMRGSACAYGLRDHGSSRIGSCRLLVLMSFHYFKALVGKPYMNQLDNALATSQLCVLGHRNCPPGKNPYMR